MDSPQETTGGGAKTEGMTRCPYCGAKNKDTFEYCVRCSEPLDEFAPEGVIAQSRATLSTLLVGAVMGILALAALALVLRPDAEPPVSSGPATPTTPAGPPQAPVGTPLPEIDSDEVLAALADGLQAFNQEDYQEAVFHFEEAVRSLPDNPTAHQYLGLAHYHLGNYEDAADALADARYLRPDSFQLLDHYVTACKKGGDLERATDALRDYVGQHPDAINARLELTRLAREQGNHEEAIQHAEALAGEGGNAELSYELGVSLKEAGMLDEAKAALRSSIELNADSPVAHHALGVTELLSGNAESAVAPLQAAVARAPENGDYHFSLAQAYEKLDRVQESLAAYEAYLEHARPDDPKAKVVKERLAVAKKTLARRRAAGGKT